MKLFIIFSLCLVSDTILHFYYNIICLNKCILILYSKINIVFNELDTIFAIRFFEKGLTSGYLRIENTCMWDASH